VLNPSGGPGSVLHRADEVVQRHPWWAFTAAYLLLAGLLIGVNLDTVPLRRFDGAYYATEAREVYRGNGRLTKHILPIQLLKDPEHRPPLRITTYTNKPLFPWLMAVAFHLFGATDHVAMWTCFFFYLACGPLLFYFVKGRWGFWPGLLAVFILLLSPSMIDASTAGWTDMLFTTLVLSATFMVILLPPRLLWTSGLVMAGLCLCRPNGLVIAAVLSLVVFFRVVRLRQWSLVRRWGHLALCALPLLLSLAFLFHFNYQHYGSPLRFYDSNGWERLEMTNLLPNPKKFNGYCFYYTLPPGIMDRYWADPSIALGQFKRKVKKTLLLLKDALLVNPLKLLFIVLGLLWIPRWRRDRTFRSLGLITGACLVLQYLAAYSQLPFARLYTWMLPCLAVMTSLAVCDLWSLWGRARRRWPRAATLLRACLVLALVGSVAWGAVAEGYRLGVRNSYLKKFRALNVIRGQMLKKYTDKDSLVIVNYHESWLAWFGDRHFTRVPFRLTDFLGVVKKINTPYYYLMGIIRTNRKRGLARARCPESFYPQIASYAKLVTIKKTPMYYVALFRLDMKRLRRDFAQQIAALP